MIIMKDFSEYTPEGHDDLRRNGVKFIRDNKGKDWYASQNLFQKNTMKIVFISESGVIIDCSTDITELWPLAKEPVSIAEVSHTDDDLRGKLFNTKTLKVTARVVDLHKQALRRISDINKGVREKLVPLQCAKDLGIITEEENKTLVELQKYLVAVSRVPKQKGFPDVVGWPEEPKG